MRILHVHGLDYAALEEARPLGYRLTSRAFTALLAALATWRAASMERGQLLAFGDGELKDLGLSRADAAREADRPVWPEVRAAAVAAWRAT